jgi:LysM repeat protein
VPLADLLAHNHLERDDLLRPGDRILVKLGQGQAPPPPPTRPAVHIVHEGETLWTIAVLYDMKVDELLALNGLQRGAVIRPGDKLALSSPQAAATPTSTPTPVSTQTRRDRTYPAPPTSPKRQRHPTR